MMWTTKRNATVVSLVALLSVLEASASMAADSSTSNKAAVPKDDLISSKATRNYNSYMSSPSSVVAQASDKSQDESRSGKQKRAPGSFDVDEIAAQRALERTLTQAGALLLQKGMFEISPGFSYTRVEQNVPVLTTITNPLTGSPVTVLASEQLQRNEFSARLDVRAGMVFDSQLELSLPYNYVREKYTGDFSGETSSNGSGVDDFVVGLAKTIHRERGWTPDLIGRVRYNFGSGSNRDNDVILGGGYRQLTGEIVALKRQDPIVFVGALSYSRIFEENNIKPGEAMVLSFSALLAASPQTSLQFGFNQIYQGRQETLGREMPGTSSTYGIFTLGASSVLSRTTTLVTQLGIGLSDEAPKYNFTVSLPILF